MDVPDGVTHSIPREGRLSRARPMSLKDGRGTSIVETSIDWDDGSFDSHDHDDIIHPGHRSHLEAVLANCGRGSRTRMRPGARVASAGPWGGPREGWHPMKAVIARGRHAVSERHRTRVGAA